MDKIKIKVKKLPGRPDHVPLPKKQTDGAAGYDVCAANTEPIVLGSGEAAAVPTGLALEIPPGWEVQVRPRSGLALKYGITLPNAPGTIDSDYRGELMVIMMNLGPEDFLVKAGDRIAQLVVGKTYEADWEAADLLEDSDRGEGGFGSTGR